VVSSDARYGGAGGASGAPGERGEARGAS